MSSELKKISDNIMNQIHDEKIKMKPKIYFILGSAFTLIGLVSSVIASIFFIGLTRFYFRSHGPMADYRFDQMLTSFPWWVPFLAISGLIIGIWLLRKYDFSFKVSFKFLILYVILAVLIGGWIVDGIGLNDALTRRGPMQGMMRKFMQDNRRVNGRGIEIRRNNQINIEYSGARVQ